MPKVVIRVSQAPVLDINVRPCWAGRPGDRDVDLRPRPRILVRGKLRWRRWVHVQEGGLTPFLHVRFRHVMRVVCPIAICRRCVSGLGVVVVERLLRMYRVCTLELNVVC